MVGAGPIGLATIMRGGLHSPGRLIAIDLADSRLESTTRFGADVTINNGREDAVARVMKLTDGLGADVAIEAVGVPATARRRSRGWSCRSPAALRSAAPGASARRSWSGGREIGVGDRELPQQLLLALELHDASCCVAETELELAERSCRPDLVEARSEPAAERQRLRD